MLQIKFSWDTAKYGNYIGNGLTDPSFNFLVFGAPGRYCLLSMVGTTKIVFCPRLKQRLAS
jgi:hypothetical protein